MPFALSKGSPMRHPFLAALLASTLLAAPAIAATAKHRAITKSDRAAEQSATQAVPDTDMQAVLDALASLGGKPIEKLSAAEARKQPTPADAVKKILADQGKSTAPEAGVTTKELTYPAGKGTQKARIYIPDGVAAHAPVVVYYHGGGWVIADIDVYDAAPRAIAKQTGAIVVSAEYRHAPEHKFPAAHEDAVAAYKWVVKNADSWGGDASKVAVMGESAGGNLAINTAIAARDQGLTAPVAMALIYPVAGTDMSTLSYQENAQAKPLNKAMMGWFVGHTIKSEADKADPRLDLIKKANLKGLPPATVVLAQIDPLRSDGEMLAEKLTVNGVSVHKETWEGVTHEFFGMAPVVGDAQEAQKFVADDLKKAFAM